MIFSEVENIDQDFEVKKFMLGLSRFIDPNVPAEVHDQLSNIMKGLVYLSNRSI